MSLLPRIGETPGDEAGRAFGEGCGQHRLLHILVVVNFGGLLAGVAERGLTPSRASA